jgi:uncharacterized membrane protein YeaQ/YmgE (transglycosylase-associated protein family)
MDEGAVPYAARATGSIEAFRIEASPAAAFGCRAPRRDAATDHCHADAMAAPGLFIVMVIGLLAGALGRLILRGRPSRFSGLAAGFVGAIAGVPIAEALGFPITGLGLLALAALAGAVVLLAAWSLLRRR